MAAAGTGTSAAAIGTATLFELLLLELLVGLQLELLLEPPPEPPPELILSELLPEPLSELMHALWLGLTWPLVVLCPRGAVVHSLLGHIPMIVPERRLLLMRIVCLYLVADID